MRELYAVVLCLLLTGCRVSTSARFRTGQESASASRSSLREPPTSGQAFLRKLREPENQPRMYWAGSGSWSLRESSSSGGGWGMQFGDSESHYLEWHDEWWEARPLVFLPLIESGEGDLMLTALYAYLYRGGADVLSPAQVRTLRDAVRRHARNHADLRVRWTAFRLLAENRWQEVEDFRHAMADRAAVMRIDALFWLSTLAGGSDTFAYHPDGRLSTGRAEDLPEARRRRAEIVPILLEHLNDTHFYVRQTAGSGIVQLTRHWTRVERGWRPDDYPHLPEKVDWARASWHDRQAAQQAWKNWWDEHGEDAILWALPEPTPAAPAPAAADAGPATVPAGV